MPDIPRFEVRPTEPTSVVCPHRTRDVSLPSEEPHLAHGVAEFRPKLVAFPCPLCTETIRLDN